MTFFNPRGASWLWSYGSLFYKCVVQSLPTTTEVVRANPANGEVYLIQHYVIKFVSDLW